MDEVKKNIDEGWKEAAEKEKQNLKNNKPFVPLEPDFSFFVTTLALQASISLGQIPNPATNKTEEDLTQAKFLIDTLGMLEEKTKGNLKAEEAKLLESLLYDLRMVYVSKNKGETK
jgi:hypothetical protein